MRERAAGLRFAVVVNGRGSTGLRVRIALAVAALMVLACAASARADIVYDAGASAIGKPNKIVVAHDDGSGAQTIVTTYANPGSVQASGLEQVLAPAVSPSGKSIVFEGTWDQAHAEQARWSPFAAGACGIWCSGVYKYDSGTLTRVSPDPSPCPQAPCAVFDLQPEITSGGTVVATYEAVSDQYSCVYSCGWFTANSYVGLDRPRRSGDFFSASATDIPSACTGGDLSNRPEYPSPSPDGTRVVYVNCRVDNVDNTTIVSNIDGSGQSRCGSDDQPIADPSFSLDGSRIVDAESGNDPGLWSYPSACPPANNAYVHALAAPSGTSFDSPRYVAGGKIIFVAIPDGAHGGDVWSIPVTCGQNGTPCQFPADATQITHTSNDVINVSWTSQGLVQTPPSPTTGKPRCVVPNLHGKTLKAAGKALAHAHCRLGKVRKRHAARRLRGKVVSQSPKPRAHRPAGTRVAVVVGK